MFAVFYKRKMNKHFKILFFAFALLSFAWLTSSCNPDDDFSSSPDLRLEFSADTISFDTVFSAQTSVTARLKVFNRSKDAVRISSIALLGGNDSPFRINVSGRQSASQSFRDVELRGKDSLYVFVKVTIDSTNENNPIIFTDAIEFITNGNTQEVQLRAAGQDAEVFQNITLTENTTLTADKPYLIFGNLTVEKGITLTLSEGCKLYFHANSGIVVNGNLQANGSLEKPILLRGDRLDYLFEGMPYDTLSGQWNGIRLGSGNHTLNNVEMRSGRTAIHIEPTEEVAAELTLINSKIHNFDSCGIWAKNAKIRAANTQISNCMVHCVALTGGESDFTHCTVANFYPLGRRKMAAVFISNKEVSGVKTEFKNSIVFGNRENSENITTNNEIELDNTSEIPFDVKFRFCLLNEKSTNINNAHFEKSILANLSQNIFVNTKTYPYDFRLTEDSPARNVADLTIAAGYPTDKNGKSRSADGLPDVGAYEY